MTATLIWCVAIGAALLGAFLRGLDLVPLLPFAFVGWAPAIVTLLIFPFLKQEWAQNLLIFSWLILAVVSCIGATFIPFAALFLAPVAISALLQKEKVIEAMLFSVAFAAIVFFLDQRGFIPGSLASEAQLEWARNAAIIALLFLIVAAMYGAARSKEPVVVVKRVGSSGAEKALLQTIPGATLRVSAKNNILYSTSRSLNLFGVSNVIGTVSARSLAEHDSQANSDLMDLISKVRKSGDAKTEIISLRQLGQDGEDSSKDALVKGKVLKIEVTASPLPKQEIGIYARDVTEREAAYDRLRSGVESAYQDASGRTLFFAGVSHELRTPLNAIIGFSDMMRSRLFGPLPSKYAEYADLIHNSGQHMLDLIGDVLDMTKVDAGKYGLHYSDFDVADVIRSTLKMIRPMADDADVTLDAEIKTQEDLIVRADRKAVRQILLNLISNAIKFTPKGGRIVVRATSLGGTLNLMVSDNGVGMSSQDLRVIGTPFSQGFSAQLSEERGSGLGLSLVKSLVELHGGRISFASQVDEGTTVDIYLPQKPEAKDD